MTTKVIKIEHLDEKSLILLDEAANILRNEGLVVFPTETVYGLGAIATDAKAAEKIYAAKGRPSDNPLIVHIAYPEDAEKYAYTSKTYYRLAEVFMPGPLTVIMPAKESVPKATRGGLSTVALRCPVNPIAHALIEKTGIPIAAPSANRSGSPSPTVAEHVIDDMDGRVDMIIDGGESSFGLESTIVSIQDDGDVMLLRPGKITVEDLNEIGISVKISSAVTSALKPGEVALSPGMKYRHYAPSAPVFLLDGNFNKAVAYLENKQNQNIALFAYAEDLENFKKKLPHIFLYNYGKKADLLEQSHELFYLLREADKQCFDAIYIPLPEKKGVGLALYNRLIRAAAYQILSL